MVAERAEQVLPTVDQIPLYGYPDRPLKFVHDIHLNDRLTNAAIADLADRLPRESVCYERAAQDLVLPDGGPPRGALERPGDVIRDLDNANAWLSLLNAEEDPAITDLMMSVLDQLEPGAGHRLTANSAWQCFDQASEPA